MCVALLCRQRGNEFKDLYQFNFSFVSWDQGAKIHHNLKSIWASLCGIKVAQFADVFLYMPLRVDVGDLLSIDAAALDNTFIQKAIETYK